MDSSSSFLWLNLMKTLKKLNLFVEGTKHSIWWTFMKSIFFLSFFSSSSSLSFRPLPFISPPPPLHPPLSAESRACDLWPLTSCRPLLLWYPTCWSLFLWKLHLLAFNYHFRFCEADVRSCFLRFPPTQKLLPSTWASFNHQTSNTRIWFHLEKNWRLHSDTDHYSSAPPTQFDLWPLLPAALCVCSLSTVSQKDSEASFKFFLLLHPSPPPLPPSFTSSSLPPSFTSSSSPSCWSLFPSMPQQWMLRKAPL